MSNVYFMGMNSHGSDYPWSFFLEQIKKRGTTEGRAAVCFECSTYDMLISDIIRNDLGGRNYNHFFSWWMKSSEVSHFINVLDAINTIDIFGIDISSQRVENKTVQLAVNAKKKCTRELLSLDSDLDYEKAMDDFAKRECLMYQKLKRVLSYGYDDVFVICHNFHASKKSWLTYKTICQMLSDNNNERHRIKSIATASKRMSFIAKIDDKNLGVKTIEDCIHNTVDRVYNVKMISAFFRNEREDALRLSVSIPEHYDHIEVFNCGEPANIKRVAQ